MLKIIIYFYLFLSIYTCLGQTDRTNNNSSEKGITKACQMPIENKLVELCNIHLDTLTYVQLKKCAELKIRNNKNQIITSFVIQYLLPDGSLRECRRTGNRITEDIIRDIDSLKINKISIEEIYGKEGMKNIVIGHRNFYFK